MDRSRSTAAGLQAGSLLAWVLLWAAAGCTMCPDPYDYSGPVPDGTAPQNDFHSRAGGILPLGNAPIPWPPVVEAEGLPPSVLVAESPASEAPPEAPDPDTIIR